MKNLPRLLSMAVSIVGGFALLYWMQEKQDESKNKTSIAVSQDIKSDSFPAVGGAFELVDQNNKVRKDSDFRGKVIMVYFGYSFCPDICPTGLSAMTQALKMLKPHQAQKIQPLFITVDPERDTPENLKPYMENFHQDFIALTGTKEQINDIKKQYHVYAAKVQPDGTTTDYLVDHSSIVYVMDRQGQFVAHFNHGTEPEQMAEVLKKALG